VVDDDGKTHYGKEAAQAVVTAKLLGEQKGDKVHVFKYKNKSGYARRQGHRQLMTLIEIAEVKLGSAPKRATAPKAEKKPAKDEAAEPAEAAEAAE
jgi:large subunit ribosomal protein L21